MEKMQKSTFEEMKEEARKRINIIKKAYPDFLGEEVKRGFNKNTPIFFEPRKMFGKVGGVLWSVKSHQEYDDVFTKVIEKYHGIPYMAILTFTEELGDHLSVFYVSEHKEEWEDDKKMLEEFYDGSLTSYCYVENLTYPDMSEIGLIGFKEAMGGLVRTF